MKKQSSLYWFNSCRGANHIEENALLSKTFHILGSQMLLRGTAKKDQLLFVVVFLVERFYYSIKAVLFIKYETQRAH